MHKVERAIILAAGIGKRMNPVTLKTPKPLVKVNGVRMIDTIIKALYDNGITEIYIVVGYLKEQFSEVLKEYQLGIFEMQADDVIEIDSLDELIDLDNSYECFREKEE